MSPSLLLPVCQASLRTSTDPFSGRSRNPSPPPRPPQAAQIRTALRSKAEAEAGVPMAETVPLQVGADGPVLRRPMRSAPPASPAELPRCPPLVSACTPPLDSSPG